VSGEAIRTEGLARPADGGAVPGGGAGGGRPSALFGVRDRDRNAYEEVVHEHARDGWRLVQIFAPGTERPPRGPALALAVAGTPRTVAAGLPALAPLSSHS
jgi:hypothetical protein